MVYVKKGMVNDFKFDLNNGLWYQDYLYILDVEELRILVLEETQHLALKFTKDD